ncbi:N-acetylcitrulline deacetylase [Luteibacter rhizovicinus]|uniref:N-acetyl-L-citrulline deacetylase n=1 Tax=Luteibacter rhizovicinus TaxID=242606 RepID=A0A4R3YVM4_9GAMM|nr:acetylornithine deacetylase [Luteibacter rhizovicinus]TCV97165.1 N-acetylcitrulline deacetylase [Luteibacter rhizovicinus]
MNKLLEDTLTHLRALVGFDTRNPPRTIGTGGIFDYLRSALPGFDVQVTDFGAGAVNLYAVRGKPKYLFNVHMDTVPDSPHWTASPFELRVDGERAVGLGACDIKGAAAALVAVAHATSGDMALLLSTDEEANDARCIDGFLKTPRDYAAIIVAEPTKGEAVLAHRGIHSVQMSFSGRAGHASGEQKPSDSALHQAIRWGAAALDFVQDQSHERFGGLTGLRFNIGKVEGGIKANVIAPTADVRFGFRPLPSMDADRMLETFRTLVEPYPVTFGETFRGDSLPAGDTATAESRRLAARDIADELEIPVGNAVDFWTESALFSAAGFTSFVYGPGDIAQAHSADEWVALDQLQQYAQTIYRIVESGNA